MVQQEMQGGKENSESERGDRMEKNNKQNLSWRDQRRRRGRSRNGTLKRYYVISAHVTTTPQNRTRSW
jgi:hypothetical protein